jgi:mono/diheme cytochrome c family protein
MHSRSLLSSRAAVRFPARCAAVAALAFVLCAAGTTQHVGDHDITVIDGYKVDPYTFEGFRTWRAAACDRCHGANQQGLVGPSLIEGLKTLSKDDFVKTVRDGRLDKGMVSFKTSKMVMDNIDNLYVYLKGRSMGVITRARVEPLKEGE